MDVSICLVMDVMDVGTGLESDRYWDQGFGGREVHSEKKKTSLKKNRFRAGGMKERKQQKH